MNFCFFANLPGFEGCRLGIIQLLKDIVERLWRRVDFYLKTAHWKRQCEKSKKQPFFSKRELPMRMKQFSSLDEAKERFFFEKVLWKMSRRLKQLT